MKEYNRMKLWAVSFWKPLFREELITITELSQGEQLLDLFIYCYEKYSDMHPEILAEVFSEYREKVNHAGYLEN